MANRDRPARIDSKRAYAVQRLNEVVMERRRLRDSQARTSGTSIETGSTVSLRAVDDQVTSPKPRLKNGRYAGGD
jgi:hypothetical protein